MNSKIRAGFTLIELSIVLVIIGLIVGGVLVGRDLIASATIRKQITQFQEYSTAFATFQSKYNCLPGDCTTATNFNLGTNGNGNAVLESAGGDPSPDQTTFDGEIAQFFVHLSNAGLIKGKYDTSLVLGKGYPRLAINDAFGMIAASQWGAGINGTDPNNLLDTYKFPMGIWLFAEMCAGLSTNPAPQTANDGCGVMTATQAKAIDQKIDDGLPVSGRVWGYSSYYLMGCVDVANSVYITPSNVNYCQMDYRLY